MAAADGLSEGGGAEQGTADAGGERWGAVVLDRASRFLVAWASGPRDERLAYAVVSQMRARTTGRTGVRWVSGGWTLYAAAIMAVSWDRAPDSGLPWRLRLPVEGVALTQAVKHRTGRRLERLEVRAVIGEAADLPHTVHVERQHGVAAGPAGLPDPQDPCVRQAGADPDRGLESGTVLAQLGAATSGLTAAGRRRDCGRPAV